MPRSSNTNIHPQVSTDFERINKLILTFLGLNIAFALVVFALHSSLDVASAQAVESRAVSFVIVSFLLLFFHRKMVSGKRWAWKRLRIVSIIAPIGILVFLLQTHGLPWWVDAIQVLGAAIYALIAVLVNREHFKQHFPKEAKAKV